MADELVRKDPESETCFAALAELIASEISARLAVGVRIDTPEGVRGLSELIADTVLDAFVMRQRSNDTPRYARSK